MQYLGYDDAKLTLIGPDEGVDVFSSRAVAQVKSGETPTGRPVVQQIYGVAALSEKEPMLFSVAPITREGKEWAARASVALFRLDLSGSATPANPKAAELFATAGGRLMGWQAVRAELETLIREQRPAQISARFEVPNAYRGYWSIRHAGDGAVLMSRDFAGSEERPVESVDFAVDMLEGKLRELGGRFSHCDPVLSVDGVERPFRPRLHYPEFDDEEIEWTDFELAIRTGNLEQTKALVSINSPRQDSAALSPLALAISGAVLAEGLFPSIVDENQGVDELHSTWKSYQKAARKIVTVLLENGISADSVPSELLYVLKGAEDKIAASILQELRDYVD